MKKQVMILATVLALASGSAWGIFGIVTGFAGGPVNVLELASWTAAWKTLGTAVSKSFDLMATTLVAAIQKSATDAKAMGNLDLRYRKELALGRSYVDVDSNFDRQIEKAVGGITMMPSTSDGILYSGSIRASEMARASRIHKEAQGSVAVLMDTKSHTEWQTNIYKAHMKHFYDTEMEKRGLCLEAASPSYQNIDLLASNLFLTGDESNGEYDGQQRIAASMYIDSMIEAMPTGDPDDSFFDTPQGQFYLAGRQHQVRMADVARNALLHIYHSRVSDPTVP